MKKEDTFEGHPVVEIMAAAIAESFGEFPVVDCHRYAAKDCLNALLHEGMAVVRLRDSGKQKSPPEGPEGLTDDG